MKYSEKLNGYWEEGYHYYLEFRDDRLTVRNYRRDIAIETTIEYDAELLERGERTLIKLENAILSRDYQGEMMTEIKELVYEAGELKLLYNYTICGETLYSLHKTENGPFSHIIIHEDMPERLQGHWIVWHADLSSPEDAPAGEHMTIKDGHLFFGGRDAGSFRCVSYKSAPGKKVFVRENLIDNSFGFFSNFELSSAGDSITAYLNVSDLNVPPSIFVREEGYASFRQKLPDWMTVHPTNQAPDANRTEQSMTNQGMGTLPTGMSSNDGAYGGPMQTMDSPMRMMGVMASPGMLQSMQKLQASAAVATVQSTENRPAPPKFCPECGRKTEPTNKFCAGCGSRL